MTTKSELTLILILILSISYFVLIDFLCINYEYLYCRGEKEAAGVDSGGVGEGDY